MHSRTMSDGLVRAVWLVLSTLRLLQQRPDALGIVAATDQIRAAVEELPAGLTSKTLALVVEAIEDCHRTGEVSSPSLEQRLTAAFILLRLAVVQ